MICEWVLIQMSEWRGWFYFVSCRVQHVGYCTYFSTPNIVITPLPRWKCHSLLPVIFFHCTLLLVHLYIVRYWYCTHFVKKLYKFLTWTEQVLYTYRYCTCLVLKHKNILNMNCSVFVYLLILCVLYKICTFRT